MSHGRRGIIAVPECVPSSYSKKPLPRATATCNAYSNMKVATSSLISVFGILALAVISTNAQFHPPVDKKACDEKYSLELGNCISAHPKDPSNPERAKCTIASRDKWNFCLHPWI
ncbi:hypothetical protein KVV02_000628 [Mortierella alpina]|uniref:Uncharacterized protein n=1 Tax=Mortierella alpina TaxID=64518 RepID=A0A9P7ZWC5_MORAP|nr:hypothetical protein KVV02_000628 [Mortierella alpina]